MRAPARACVRAGVRAPARAPEEKSEKLYRFGLSFCFCFEKWFNFSLKVGLKTTCRSCISCIAGMSASVSRSDWSLNLALQLLTFWSRGLQLPLKFHTAKSLGFSAALSHPLGASQPLSARFAAIQFSESPVLVCRICCAFAAFTRCPGFCPSLASSVRVVLQLTGPIPAPARTRSQLLAQP